MKKYLLLLVGVTMCISLIGCQKNLEDDNVSLNGQQQEQINSNVNTNNGNSNNENSQNEQASKEEIDEVLDESFTKDSYFTEDDMSKFATTQIISLEENPTTGYTWHYRFGEDGIAVVEDDEFVANNTDGMVGAGGIHTYRLSGVKLGETGIKFEYRRAWEDKEPIKIISYEITVDENNQIAITEENMY